MIEFKVNRGVVGSQISLDGGFVSLTRVGRVAPTLVPRQWHVLALTRDVTVGYC